MIPKLFWQSAIPKHHWYTSICKFYSLYVKINYDHFIETLTVLLFQSWHEHRKKWLKLTHLSFLQKLTPAYSVPLCINYTQPYLLTPCSWWSVWPSSVVTDPGVCMASGDSSWGRGSWQYYHAWFSSYRSNNICANISKGVGNTEQTYKIAMSEHVSIQLNIFFFFFFFNCRIDLVCCNSILEDFMATPYPQFNILNKSLNSVFISIVHVHRSKSTKLNPNQSFLKIHKNWPTWI